MNQIPHSDEELDVTAFVCPMPLLKMKQKLTMLVSGAVLHVITSDKSSVRDFTVFLKQAGHGLLQQSNEGELYHFWIQKR
ncbi:MAG TPA: sulfurtransferase TusA family protein [Pseudomonadales bacterium]|nr:sulfurtransferase TusA family protein [Pseudomonadales bacterium]